MAIAKEKKLMTLVRRQGVLRPAELTAQRIPRIYLTRLVEKGSLERLSRGLYALADRATHEQQSLVEACKRVPAGVVCLLSALQFHHVTTQAPFEVWLALPPGRVRPRVDYPPLRIVNFSRQALASGTERHIIQKVPVTVTTLARTVVDCFVYRHKIGLDVALEALREAWRAKRVTMDELYRQAQQRRMTNVMKPYLEAIT